VRVRGFVGAGIALSGRMPRRASTFALLSSDPPLRQLVSERLADLDIVILDVARRDNGAVAIAGVTERQREVLSWLAIGLDNTAIGKKLHIGERAVKAHVSTLLELFDLDNRTQLALLADRAGIRPPRR
jgi:DNA-binding NarL/FixJ family response regulator